MTQLRICRMLRRCLTPYCEIVGELDDGSGVVVEVSLLRPDVVVVDHLMPGMTGDRATLSLKSRFPSVRVVAYTSSEESVDQMLSAEAAYLKSDVRSLIDEVADARTTTRNDVCSVTRRRWVERCRGRDPGLSAGRHEGSWL